MAKIRIYQLAKQLNISNKELMDHLKSLGIDAKSHQSSIEEESAKLIEDLLKPVQPQPQHEEITKTEEEVIPEPQKQDNIIKLESTDITVKDLAEKINTRPADLIKELMMLGILATINQRIDLEVAAKAVEKLGFILDYNKAKESMQQDLTRFETSDDPSKLKARPPVVTIMGHVDHGKTKLLDAIRKSNLIDKEAGGITQHIGAYKVDVNGKSVTFLDTPGHEAFTTLRARGAKVTDIAILVVAADDGIMPQTLEAIHHARAANVPIIVAINKIDKPESNIDRVKQQLAEQGLVPEDWGGQVVTCNISAKKVEGIGHLLEMILLVAEVADLKANPDGPASGVIVESKMDKSKGPIATVLIRKGTLNIGDPFVVGSTFGKIRALINDHGKRVKKATPSAPVEIIGISEVPQAGSTFQVVPDEKTAKDISQKLKDKSDSERLGKGKIISLESYAENIKSGQGKSLNLIIKADVHGSLEAISQSVGSLANKDAKVNIIHSATGSITESDIMLAKASEAIIVGFNIPILGSITELAEREGIDIHMYNIIYHLIDDVKKAMEGMLLPEYEEAILGKAEIRKLFESSKLGIIAGCFVTEGKLTRGTSIKIFRGGKLVFQGKLDSLKRFKDDVKEVVSGFECGIVVKDYSDFVPNDAVESFEIREKPKKLK